MKFLYILLINKIWKSNHFISHNFYYTKSFLNVTSPVETFPLLTNLLDEV